MENSAILSIILNAKDQASSVINQVSSKMESSSRQVQEANAKTAASAQVSAEKSNQAAQSAGGGMNKWALGATAAGATMVGMGATFSHVGNDAFQAADTWAKGVRTLALQTGMTTQETSKLIYAGQHFGVSSQSMTKDLGIFSKQVSTAAQDTAKHQSALTKMGVAVKDSSGHLKPMSALLGEVSDKFKTMPNGPEKTAEAMKLFGKSGKDLLPLLNQGSEGLAKFGEEAQKAGMVLSDKTIGQLKQYDIAQRESKENMEAFKISMGIAAAGPMLAFANGTKMLTDKINGLPGPLKEAAGTTLTFGGPILKASGSMVAFVGSLGLAASAMRDFGAASKVMSLIGSAATPIGITIIAITALALVATLVISHWSQVKEWFEKTFGGIYASISSTFEKVRNVVEGVWGKVMGVMKTNAGVAIAAIMPFIGIPLLIAAHWGQISSIVEKAFKPITKIIGDVGFAFQKIGELFSGADLTLPANRASKPWISFVVTLMNMRDQAIAIFDHIKAAVIKFVDGAEKVLKPIGEVVIGIFKAIGAAVLPVLNGIGTVIIFAFKIAWDLVKLIWQGAVLEFKGWVLIIGFAFKLISGVISGIFKVEWAIISAVWSVAAPVFKAIIGAIIAVFKGIAGVLVSIFKLEWRGIVVIWNVASAIFGGIIGAIKVVFNAFVGVARAIFQAEWNGVVAIWNIASTIFNGIVGGIKIVFNGIRSFISTIFRMEWQGLQNIWNGAIGFFGGIIGGIRNVISGVAGAISEPFTAGFNAVKSIAQKVMDFISGAINTAIGTIKGIGGALHGLHIPGFATGTNFAPGGLAMVGENGPELVNLPRGSQVIPNSQLGHYGSTQTITIGQVVLTTPAAVDRFFNSLDQDTINMGKGLAPVRGGY